MRIDGYSDLARLNSSHASGIRSQSSQQLSSAKQLDHRAQAQAISEQRSAPSMAALQRMSEQASASAASLADSDPLKSFASRLSTDLSASTNSLSTISEFSQFQSAAGTAYQQLSGILQQADTRLAALA